MHKQDGVSKSYRTITEIIITISVGYLLANSRQDAHPLEVINHSVCMEMYHSRSAKKTNYYSF